MAGQLKTLTSLPIEIGVINVIPHGSAKGVNPQPHSNLGSGVECLSQSTENLNLTPVWVHGTNVKPVILCVQANMTKPNFIVGL